MANFVTTNSALAQHFATQMASLEPSVKIQWENAQPLSQAPDPRTAEWCRYSFRPGLDQIGALGGITWRGTGVLMIQVFTPLGRGQGPNLDILRNVQTLFRTGSPISGVRIESYSIAQQGATDDGWYQGTASIRFEIDELLS